jgi:hypothetical protein
MTLSQKLKIKDKNDKSKSKNLAFPFSVVARLAKSAEAISWWGQGIAALRSQ